MVYRGLWVFAVAAGFALGGVAWAEQAGAAWHEQDRGSYIADEGPRMGTASHIALYPVNRLLDTLDILSVHLGFGLGLHANARGTRALQVGFGATAVSRLGLEGRRAGFCNESKAEFSILPFSFEHFRRHNSFGTYLDYSSSRDVPMLYEIHRDYWGVGAEATAAIVNVGAEAHLLEVPDLVLGLVGMDIMHDDLPRRPIGVQRNRLRSPATKAIQTIVVVPSRVTREKTVRMERADGLGVYYRRFSNERFFGLLGTAFGAGADRAAEERFNTYLAAKGFDGHREVLERVGRVVELSRDWKVVGGRETMELFRKHAVTKSWGGHRLRRLPNYPGLARHYQADAVLDVRIWEWGVWRRAVGAGAKMRMDCEFKLVAYPKNEVLLDVRLIAELKEKPGMSIEDFGRGEGDLLIQESRDAMGIITSSFTDIMREAE